MRTTPQSILTINGGSSSIRFAMYEVGVVLRRLLNGKIDRIGLSGTALTVHGGVGGSQAPRRLPADGQHNAVALLLDWLEAAALILANLTPSGEMSRHRVGLALPVGMQGEKKQWAAKPSAA